MAKLNEMILEFRESVNQSIEALAMLLQLSPEEYIRLEKDWIPPDDVLQRLCSLFKWNYQDIKRISMQFTFVENPPNSEFDSNPESTTSTFAFSFKERLKQARTNVDQTPEGMAMLLGVSEDYYLQLEGGSLPYDDLLHRICSLFSWNFQQIRQNILTRHNPVFTSNRPLLSYEEIRESGKVSEPLLLPDFPEPQQLHERLREARQNVSQNIDGLALLLQVSPEYYEQIESGETAPDEELLKRIAALYQWNYQDLLNDERRSRFSHLQSPVTVLQTHTQGDASRELREVLRIISEGWIHLQPEQQCSLLTQLELIRDTMQRWSGKISRKSEEPSKT